MFCAQGTKPAMTKTKTSDGEAGRAKKKPVAKKPAPAKKAKPAAKKPAPRPKKKPEKAAASEAAFEAAPTQVVEVIEVFEAADTGAPAIIEDIEDAEILAETPLEAEPAPALTEEEQALSAIYGDDLTAPATAHAEYQDRQTADEDRPMLPEINARDERKAHWQDRRNQRRQRRDQRDQDRQVRQAQPARPAGAGGEQQQARQGESQQRERPPQQQLFRDGQPARPSGDRLPAAPVAPTQINGHQHDSLARVGTPLGDAAATVFAQLRNGQPLPVRQLAAMMRKRNLIESDPEQMTPQLKAELIGDERSYRTLGLRPRIVYRGRDLFAPGPVSMSVTADAEAGFAAALSRLAGATHRALAQRLMKASPAGFERLIHAYLVAAGYREISWVKRIGGISYAQATAPGIGRTVLVSARSGDQPIDRRGIGELRVGVEAKNLVAGFLFSPCELSEDAEKELERAGRSIAVICGDQLVAALIASGVGVVSAAAPLHYVDDQLLDELLAG
jgi:restriction endonuclease Mrr